MLLNDKFYKYTYKEEVYTYMSNLRLKEMAVENNRYRKKNFADDIRYSCDNCVIYGYPNKEQYDIGIYRHDETNTDIIQNDIRRYMVGDARTLSGKTAVLNFASYKNPGGKYIDGRMAQEEALCHCTTLYEVLERQKSYYEWNNLHKNKGMYMDRLLYTPDILIINSSQYVVGKVDIMTCAAPNMSVGLKYGSFSVEACQAVFRNRVKFMMQVAANNNVDNLILGAWGCGVFKNDTSFVAKTFFETQKLYECYFGKVIYVINEIDKYDTFLSVAASL